MARWLTMPVDAKKRTRLAHGRVYRCTSCLYGALMPRPDPGEVSSFYRLEKYYTHGASHFEAGSRRSFLDRVREHLAWRLDRGRAAAAADIHALLRGKPAHICDIGCGAGLLASELRSLGHEVVGVERDPQAAAQAASLGIRVLHGSAEELPAGLGQPGFDVVVMSHVLEHCLDPWRAIANACSLMRRGGAFYCEVPNNLAAGLASAGIAWEMLDVPRHLNFFVPGNLLLLAGRAGLQARRMFYAGYGRQFTNQWIATEGRIFDAIAASEAREQADPWPRRNSRARAWLLLARTALARDAIKYDSVGIVAARPH